MSVVYLTNDLMFSSRVSGAAQAAGADMRVVGSETGLFETLKENNGTRLVLLDLSFPGIDPAALVPEIRSAASDTTVIAYGPHVHEQKLAAASAAGCDQVLSKGQFNSTVADLIQNSLAKPYNGE